MAFATSGCRSRTVMTRIAQHQQVFAEGSETADRLLGGRRRRDPPHQTPALSRHAEQDGRHVRLATPGLEQPVSPDPEPVVVVHEEVEDVRVPVAEVNPAQRGAAREVEARVGRSRRRQDLVLQGIEDLLEPRRVPG
jgi:hypothetical protein